MAVFDKESKIKSKVISLLVPMSARGLSHLELGLI